MKKFTLLTTSVLLVGISSIALIISMSQLKGSIQDDISDNTVMEAMENITTENETKKEGGQEYKLDLPKDKSVVLYKEENVDIKGEYVAKAYTVYQGQEVEIKDALVSKDEALENANIIMDYIYGYVDETIFSKYKIDKTNYTYKIQRQYHKNDGAYYGIFMVENDRIMASVGVTLNGKPQLKSFARDGLIDLCGLELEIPEEYLVKNYCMTSEQRNAIYEEYFPISKEIVENLLGMPAIIEEVKNIDSETYFKADDDWSTVCFGYVLENGLYVKVFYNRVNKEWDGFVVAGYHKDYR
jgi:LysM repeat protein